LSTPCSKPSEARARCVYGVGSALLLALSLATTPARAEPTRWLGLALDGPWLSQYSRMISSPLLVLAPQPARGWWPDQKASTSSLPSSGYELVSPTDAQLAALMARRPALEYTPRDSSLTLSLEPGSHCTGACLKLVGSF